MLTIGQESQATSRKRLVRARSVHVPAALHLLKKKPRPQEAHTHIYSHDPKYIQLWRSCMVGGRAHTTRARKRRGMYTGNEESRREFARWLSGPPEASRWETADPRAGSLLIANPWFLRTRGLVVRFCTAPLSLDFASVDAFESLLPEFQGAHLLKCHRDVR